MTNWEEIVNSIEAPKDMTPSEWIALGGPQSKEKPVALGSPIEIFIAKYQISKLGSSQVALTLPAGTTRIEFLREAQELSVGLHRSSLGKDKYRADQAVCPENLEAWELEQAFIRKTEAALSLRIDGCVQGSSDKTRLAQENRGWNDVTLQDLAIAHTAFYLLTGQDLFETHTVRAAGGSLFFSNYGLVTNGYADCDSHHTVSASHSLPARS